MDTSHKKAALLFHALSDPTRLALMEQLRSGEKCVCELTDVLQAAQSRLSFHLKVLKDVDLLHDRRVGRWKYYSVNKEGLNELKDVVVELDNDTNTTAGASAMRY